jgi:hypothetical protein
MKWQQEIDQFWCTICVYEALDEALVVSMRQLSLLSASVVWNLIFLFEMMIIGSGVKFLIVAADSQCQYHYLILLN